MADNNLTTKEEFLLNPVEEHNITDAAIASFETNLKHPLKVTVPITPVQDLRGMPNPYPAGASVNLIPDGTDTSNGYVKGAYLKNDGSTITDANWYISEYFRVDPNVTYTWSSRTATNPPSICFYDSEKVFISGISFNAVLSHTFIPPENTMYARSSQVSYVYQVNYPNGQAIQLEVGSTATAYRRYSNICPIEGYTSDIITRKGKNLYVYATNSPRHISSRYAYPYVATNQGRFVYLKPGTYTITFYKQSGDNVTVGMYLSMNGGTVGRIGDNATWSTRIARTIVSTGAWYNFYLYGTGLNSSHTFFFQIEVGSTSTSYEPYKSQNVPISWKHAEGTYELETIQAGEGTPSQNNVRSISPVLTLTRDDNSVLTVYGGSITFNDDGTATLTDTREFITLDGTESWTFNLDNCFVCTAYKAPSYRSGICNISYVGTSYAAINGASDFRIGINQNYIITNIGVKLGYPKSNEGAAQFGEWLTTHPIQFCYVLATPRTYTLSKTEVQRVVTALGDKVTTTVYGGTLTLNEDGSADIVKINEKVNFDDLTWTVSTSRTYPVFGADINIVSDRNRDRVGVELCSIYKPIKNLPFSVFGESNEYEHQICFNAGISTAYRFMIQDSTCETLEDFKLKITGQAAVCKLYTPITYHFPNVGQLKAFLGQNNVWSDIGNVNVKYLTQHSETGLEYRGDRALELRRRAMMADAPKVQTVVGSEETGGLASFKSYVKAPVKKIEIPFSPKQDLHGYDNPWPAGGGINLFNPNATLDNQQTNNVGVAISGNNWCISDWISVIENTDYFMNNAIPSANGYCMCFYDANKSFLRYAIVYGGGTAVRNSGADAAYLRVTVALSSKATTIVAQSSSNVSFVPYANICPIEGYDGCEVLDTGANLFDADTLYAEYKQPDGSFIASGGTFTTKRFYIPSKFIGHELTFSAYLKKLEGSSITNMRVRAFVGANQFNGNLTNSTIYQLSSVTFTPETDRDNVVVSYGNYGVYLMQVTDVQLELGSTVTEFKEYHGKTLPLIFNQAGDHEIMPIQEGTGTPSPENVRPIHPGLTFTRDDDSVLSVYGGMLTVNIDGSSSIVSNMKITDLGTYTWTYGTNNDFTTNINDIVKVTEWYVMPNLLCSKYATQTCNSNVNNGCVTVNKSSTQLRIEDLSFGGDAAAFKSAMSGVPLCYETTEPTTYTLSSTETNRALEALGLTQHIGPLYGGTITINPDGSADVVSEWRNLIYDGVNAAITNTGSFSYEGETIYFGRALLSGANVGINNTVNDVTIISDKLKTVTSNVPDSIMITSNGTAIHFRLPDHTADTKEKMNAYLATDNIEVCYKLAIPQTYHFSNLEQLKVWLGENNFWCDISDDITVKYWNRG